MVWENRIPISSKKKAGGKIALFTNISPTTNRGSMMKKEADVKKRVKEILKDLGAWYYMPVPTGYGVQGIPDFIVCYRGLFIAIETKFGGNKPSKWQEIRLREIDEHGGLALVIDEKNVEGLAEILETDRDTRLVPK